MTVREAPARGEDDMLLEAFAVSLAHESIAGLIGRRRRFTIDDLVTDHALDPSSVPFFRRLLAIVRDRGYAKLDDGRWAIAKKTGLPASRDILRTVVSEHPTRVAETVLGARAAALLPRVLREGPGTEPPYAAATLLQFAGASPSAAGLIDGIASLVAATVDTWPEDRPCRILEISAGPGALTHRLAALTADERVTVLATDPDAVAAERLRFAFAGRPGVSVQRLDLDETDAPDLGQFDFIVGAAPLGRALGTDTAARRLARMTTDRGALAVAVLAPSSFADVVFGLESDWFSHSADGEDPIGLLRTAAIWTADLRAARFGDVEVLPLGHTASPALLVLASARRRTTSQSDRHTQGHVVLVGAEAERGRRFAQELTRGFEAAGRAVHFVDHTAEYGNANGNGNGSHAAHWGEAVVARCGAHPADCR